MKMKTFAEDYEQIGITFSHRHTFASPTHKCETQASPESVYEIEVSS